MLTLFIISFAMFCLSAIIWIINIPIFNYLVIPMIEKNTGRKLNFSFFGVYNSTFLGGKFITQHVEIMKYIILKYLALKIKKNENYVKFNNEYTLQKINFKVEKASQFIIIMSFISAINYLILCISTILLIIVETFYH